MSNLLVVIGNLLIRNNSAILLFVIHILSNIKPVLRAGFLFILFDLLEDSSEG